MLFFDNRHLDQFHLPNDFRRHVEQIYSPVAYRTAGRDARMEKVDFVLGEGSANIPVVARLAPDFAGSSRICGKMRVDGNQTILVWHALASGRRHVRDMGPELEALVTIAAPHKSAMSQPFFTLDSPTSKNSDILFTYFRQGRTFRISQFNTLSSTAPIFIATSLAVKTLSILSFLLRSPRVSISMG